MGCSATEGQVAGVDANDSSNDTTNFRSDLKLCAASITDCGEYCANCIAHRLAKFGWEDAVNHLEPRLLLLTALCMPLHTRNPIITFAWAKAVTHRDQRVIDFMAIHCPDYRMVPLSELPVQAMVAGGVRDVAIGGAP